MIEHAVVRSKWVFKLLTNTDGNLRSSDAKLDLWHKDSHKNSDLIKIKLSAL